MRRKLLKSLGKLVPFLRKRECGKAEVVRIRLAQRGLAGTIAFLEHFGSKLFAAGFKKLSLGGPAKIKPRQPSIFARALQQWLLHSMTPTLNTP